jgi:hypothetical protein
MAMELATVCRETVGGFWKKGEQDTALGSEEIGDKRASSRRGCSPWLGAARGSFVGVFSQLRNYHIPRFQDHTVKNNPKLAKKAV